MQNLKILQGIDMATPINWQPSATIVSLKKRAEIIKQIRDFFAKRNVWEVETPVLSHATVTDLHLASITVNLAASNPAQPFYLQTSPEFAMKRLLAAGSGCIYQITKAFRDEEQGRLHNPEFTMLEWYRLGFDHLTLMQEVDTLLQEILQTSPAHKMTYAQVFEAFLQINPHALDAHALREVAYAKGLQDVAGIDNQDKDIWLQRLMSDVIEPALCGMPPVMIYDFPASQAALARVRHEQFPVASRFEVYYQGMELANGFHELSDPYEQKRRFIDDLTKRQFSGLPKVTSDEHLIAALAHGLPDCAGVALGVDRLVMIALGAAKIEDVIAFGLDRA